MSAKDESSGEKQNDDNYIGIIIIVPIIVKDALPKMSGRHGDDMRKSTNLKTFAVFFSPLRPVMNVVRKKKKKWNYY